jgi:hypothetical protein
LPPPNGADRENSHRDGGDGRADLMHDPLLFLSDASTAGIEPRVAARICDRDVRRAPDMAD